MPFDQAVEQWQSLLTAENVKLYYGIGVYKAGSDADDGTWKKSSDILQRQIELCRESGGDGFMFYSWEYLNQEQTREEIENVMKILN